MEKQALRAFATTHLYLLGVAELHPPSCGRCRTNQTAGNEGLSKIRMLHADFLASPRSTECVNGKDGRAHQLISAEWGEVVEPVAV